jgi:hypothetical protein
MCMVEWLHTANDGRARVHGCDGQADRARFVPCSERDMRWSGESRGGAEGSRRAASSFGSLRFVAGRLRDQTSSRRHVPYAHAAHAPYSMPPEEVADRGDGRPFGEAPPPSPSDLPISQTLKHLAK